MTRGADVETSTRSLDGVSFSFLHDLFERAARLWPDRVAVEVPPHGQTRPRVCTTYRELQSRANLLAATLLPPMHGESVIAILLPRQTADLYVAQLAVLQAGAAYTCIDPSFPDERIREILQDSQAAILITDQIGLTRSRQAAFPVPNTILPSAPADIPAAPPSPHSSPAWLTPGSLAYLIYTSGSTGRPKAVEVEHRTIVNLMVGDLAEFGLQPDDRVAQGSSASYDSSVEEIWLAFAAGATLVVMDEETARLGPDLVSWLQHENITVFCPPPTQLRAMGCARPDLDLPHLRFLYLGGEALPQDLADTWARGRLLVNGYGPTECTVTCLRSTVQVGEPISIGKPVPGGRAWVLSAEGKLLPDGEPGELCIGGPILARGYRHEAELTLEKFPVHPEYGRIYRTGDLVHRDSSGKFFYHGRIDAQVKIRGYRIELGEIEARLAQQPGVRAAACCVKQTDDAPTLAAFIIPTDPAHPPTSSSLRAALALALPTYMVPATIGILNSFPTTIGGKLDRRALASLAPISAPPPGSESPSVHDDGPLEPFLSAARHVLRWQGPMPVDADFFTALGGDSLRAAQMVTRLRGHPATAWVTVRDVYEARTLQALAARKPAGPSYTPPPVPPPCQGRRPFWSTCSQVAWLAGTGFAASLFSYFLVFHGLPWLTDRLGLLLSLWCAPFIAGAGLLIYGLFSVMLAVSTKRLLIGQYRPMRAPVWGSFYLRHWIVQHTVRLIPWAWMEGTIFQIYALRALGARIGNRVHLHRGVDLLEGGWDLLTIGDDVTVSQDAFIRLVDLEDGALVIGPVTLHDGVTLDVRAGVGGNTVAGPHSFLGALSYLPWGSQIPADSWWDGIPAVQRGPAPAPPAVPSQSPPLTPFHHGLITLLARLAMGLVLVLPVELILTLVCSHSFSHPHELLAALPSFARWDSRSWLATLLLAAGAIPVTLAWAALLSRLLGPVPIGVISRWSLSYVRIWLKTGLLEGAGEWLSGTLFWPWWLRGAGMTIGRNCEISTIIDVVPEHLRIDRDTFFADGIYLGGPRVHRGTVTTAPTRLSPDTFVGNHAVIPAGIVLPENILLGVCTVANAQTIRPGSSWFGHPPFELPRREIVECDRSLTHEPTPARYWTRVFWETARLGLPWPPLLAGLGWCEAVARWGSQASAGTQYLVVGLASLLASSSLCLLVLGSKWALLGRVQPAQHPLWSCWCGRWDFLYVMWSRLARPWLQHLEGTLLLNVYLRGMGMKLGRAVVLGPGFSQVVDPDMIEIGDDATVSAMFQAHTFEDRVLKIGKVRIGAGATVGSATVPLYGADIGDHTNVAPHSVIMKEERLLPGLHYAGSPTRVPSP